MNLNNSVLSGDLSAAHRSSGSRGARGAAGERRAGLRVLACFLLLAAPSLDRGPARAASTGTTNLLMPQGTKAESQDGDFISSSVTSTGCTGPCTAVPLDTIYRYFIEVPPGLTRLRIQIFDADIGADGAAEATLQRDRSRNNNFATTVKYTLLRPNGTTAQTETCTNAATAFCADDAWSSIWDSTTDLAAGHWELDVDQSTAVDTVAGASDINAFGIQADDGSQADATEIPIYYSAQSQIGQNLTANNTIGTKTYTFYPYITSGCSFNENDFDYDFGNGVANQNVGSIDFTSRSTSFTHNIAAANLSGNDVWKTNAVTGYTTDSDSVDYGIWKMAAAITNYNTGTVNNPTLNGNYANIYLAVAGTTTPPANNSPTPSTYRVYFPTDAGGAPLKPYMEQEARYVFAGGSGGPNPPAVGQTTTIQVTVQVVNPAAEPITFSGTNLVTVNVPGGGATYGGGAVATQGTVVPISVGGTGTITWNPGTVAAATSPTVPNVQFLTYLVNVKPTMAGQRIPVVGTVASGNGTAGTWVDETGNATLAFGPLCELAATQGVVSAAEVANLRALASGRGVVVEWQTAAEMASAGFDLYRLDDAAPGGWRKVNGSLIAALPGKPQGGTYRVLDETAPVTTPAGRSPGDVLHYVVVETETDGSTRHFPFHVAVEPADDRAPAPSLSAAGIERTPRLDADWQQRLAANPDSAGGAGNRPAAAERPAAAQRPATAALSAAATPSGPSLAIGVRQNGLFRIGKALLSQVVNQAGWAGGAKVPPYVLSTRGQPVAWTLDSDGSMLFYGQASTSIYSLDSVYWLSLGANGVAMANEPGTKATGTASSTASFTTTVNTRQSTFAATTLPVDPESDYWFWQSLIAGDPVDGTQTFTVAAPNVNAGGGQLTVHLMGASTDPHDVQVSLNGAALGNATWSGIAPQSASFPVSGWNAGGGNTVSMTAVLDSGVTSSIAYVQSVDATYERAFTTVGDALAFEGSGNALVTVTGFSGPGIHLLDISNPSQPALVTGAKIVSSGGATTLTMVPSAPATQYLAVGPAGVLSPLWTQLTANPAAAQGPGGADYLVITTRALMPAATSLAALRSAQGLRTAVVDAADVMNAFHYGSSSPHAIQSFLSWVQSHWNPVPRYVVLAGAGSFDYRNFEGLGGELLPPLMVSTDLGLFASDNQLAAPAANGTPGFAIGRLPVVSNAELQQYVAKLAAYEAAPAGSWSSQVLMFADSPGPDDGVTDYGADSSSVAAFLPAGYLPQQILVTSDDIGSARSTLFGGLAAGVGLVNYLGHAGLDRLSSLGLLTTSDATSLTNGAQLPLLAALTCNVNRFDVPGFTSLGEAMAIQPGGGAVAVWSASGPSVQPEGEELAKLFYQALANPANARLGDAVQQALSRYAGLPGLQETLQLYTVLGDPALVLKQIVPPAPSGSGPGSSTRE